MENDPQNLNINLDLSGRWLARHEVPAGPGTRCFRMSVGGESFELRLDHRPERLPYAGALPEDPRPATNQEVLLAVARAFLGSLAAYPEPEPDLARGWEEYRRHLLETHGAVLVPAWTSMSGDQREAFAAGVRACFEPPHAAVPSDQGSVISERQEADQKSPYVSQLRREIEDFLLTHEPGHPFTASSLACILPSAPPPHLVGNALSELQGFSFNLKFLISTVRGRRRSWELVLGEALEARKSFIDRERQLDAQRRNYGAPVHIDLAPPERMTTGGILDRSREEGGAA